MQRKNHRIITKALAACLAALISVLTLTSKGFADEKIPDISVLPWQLIGVDNEFYTRHHTKLDALHKQLSDALLSDSKPLDLWLEQRGRVLPYNLKHALHHVKSGRGQQAVSSPSYVVPIICRADDSIVVATEWVELKNTRLVSSQQKFTTRASWEGSDAAPLMITSDWTQQMLSSARDIDPEAPAFKIDLSLVRSGHYSVTGAHECYNMLLVHELQKTVTMPAPLDLIEGYRLRNVLMPDSPPIRATRTFLFDWGQNPKGPKITANVLASESVLGTATVPRGPVTFELLPAENRINMGEDFKKIIEDDRTQLLVKEKPQVAKIFGAWVYLDRGRAWGLDMNDRLYFEDGPRFVKGHVVGFYGSGLKIKSPRGFEVQEGAIVFIRKGQRQVKVGDSFDFDPTDFPTPWPPVRQPSKPFKN